MGMADCEVGDRDDDTTGPVALRHGPGYDSGSALDGEAQKATTTVELQDLSCHEEEVVVDVGQQDGLRLPQLNSSTG